jgi:hypothetical protein
MIEEHTPSDRSQLGQKRRNNLNVKITQSALLTPYFTRTSPLSVSDGSVKFHEMSFGWILATPTGKRLAAAAGPCNGRGN